MTTQFAEFAKNRLLTAWGTFFLLLAYATSSQADEVLSLKCDISAVERLADFKPKEHQAQFYIYGHMRRNENDDDWATHHLKVFRVEDQLWSENTCLNYDDENERCYVDRQSISLGVDPYWLGLDDDTNVWASHGVLTINRITGNAKYSMHRSFSNGDGHSYNGSGTCVVESPPRQGTRKF